MPRIWLYWLIVLATVLAASPAAAVVGRPIRTCIARVVPGDDAAAMLRSGDRFDCTGDQTRYGSGDFWVRSHPLGSGTGGPIVRFASSWQTRLTLFARYRDGVLIALPLDNVAIARHLQLGAMVEQALPVRAAPPERLLWKVEGASNVRGVVFGASLVTPAGSVRANLGLGAFYAAFAGLCIALLVYNLALWAALRHTFQLAYCVMVVALLGYAFSSSGALAWAFDGVANNDRLRVNYLTLALSAAAALAFARSFFEARVFEGWLGRASTATMAALVTTSTCFAVLAPWRVRALDFVFAASFVALMVVAGAILWRAWRRRSSYLWLFAPAWAVPIALAGLRTAGNFHLVGWSFWLDNSTIVSMSVEALLSSIAIAFRIRLLAAERDEARAHETAARRLADIDALTGLLNRRAFLREAMDRPDAHTLLLIDLDHFKQVNGAIGHDGGDEVLRVVARLLRQTTPATGLAARLGGEEFAILAPADAAPDGDTLLACLRATRMPFDVAITASIGSHTGTLADEAAWMALYGHADRALFAAKAAGRDRAVAA